MKAVLRGKFIQITLHVKKTKKSDIRDLRAQLKTLEKNKKQTHPGGVEEWK